MRSATNNSKPSQKRRARQSQYANKAIRAITDRDRVTASGRKWIAHLGDRVLCVTAWPFVKSARLLLAEGYPADTVIEMWRPNSDESALKGRLGAVAATVIDGDGARAAPRTARRSALPSGMPMRGPPPVCARPGAVSGWTMTPSNGATLLGVHDRTHCDAKRFVANPFRR